MFGGSSMRLPCRLCLRRGANNILAVLLLRMERKNGVKTETQMQLLLLMNTTYPSLCLPSTVFFSSTPASPPLLSSSPGLVGGVNP